MHKHDEWVELAKELIEEDGQQVEWVQTTLVKNTLEPWKEDEPKVTKFKTFIAFVPTSNNAFRKLLQYLKGAEVSTSRVAGLMAGGQKFQPSLKDTVIRGGKTLTIDTIDTPGSPADLETFYVIEFKG